MFVYWTMYLLPAISALARARVSTDVWVILTGILAIIVGLRYEVGADWSGYISNMRAIANFGLLEVLLRDDPGYYAFNWIATFLGLGIWLPNLVCAIIFCCGLARFVRSLPEPFLGLAVAIPYMLIVVAMGYTRQGAALGLIMWGLGYLPRKGLLPFFLAVAVAASFHKSAVIALPLAALVREQWRLTTLFGVALLTVILYFAFLAEQAEILWRYYVLSEYSQESEAASIRIMMNALPAILFIVFRRRFEMSAGDKKLWLIFSVFSLICVFLVFQAPTAVDRIALYLMPLQLVVFSYLPSVFRPYMRIYVRLAILIYYGAVMFVWLVFANNSFTWVPYRFWVFELL